MTLVTCFLLKTFTRRERIFRFRYSDILASRTPQQTPTGPFISFACLQSQGYCDGLGSNGRTLAYFLFQRKNSGTIANLTKPLTEEDRVEVRRPLAQALNPFVFLS